MTPSRETTTELQRAQWEAQQRSTALADCPVCIYILILLLAITTSAAVIEVLVAYGILK